MSDGLRFEWDTTKSRRNIARHGVSFEEASTAFQDEHGILVDDPDHSPEEDRFVLLGLSATLRVLIVCHCYREAGEVIRVISARKADQREHEGYFGRFKL